MWRCTLSVPARGPSVPCQPTQPCSGVCALDRHFGIATEPRIGSTDANLPLSLGVPALAIGAGGIGFGLHTLGEWYDPTGRELALRRILMLLIDSCSTIAGEPGMATVAAGPSLNRDRLGA